MHAAGGVRRRARRTGAGANLTSGSRRARAVHLRRRRLGAPLVSRQRRREARLSCECQEDGAVGGAEWRGWSTSSSLQEHSAAWRAGARSEHGARRGVARRSRAGGNGGEAPSARSDARRQGRRRGTPVQAGRRLRCSKCDARAGWVEFVDGPLRVLEGRVGGRGHDGAVASRAQRRGRREDLWRGMLRRLSASAKVRPRARAERRSAFAVSEIFIQEPQRPGYT